MWVGVSLSTGCSRKILAAVTRFTLCCTGTSSDTARSEREWGMLTHRAPADLLMPAIGGAELLTVPPLRRLLTDSLSLRPDTELLLCRPCRANANFEAQAIWGYYMRGRSVQPRVQNQILPRRGTKIVEVAIIFREETIEVGK